MPETDTEHTVRPTCRVCGLVIDQRVPAGLTGEWEHVQCRNNDMSKKEPEKMTAAEYREQMAAANAGGAVRSTRAPSQTIERDISKAVADILDARGVWHTRTQAGAAKLASGGYMRLCRPGTPDRFAAPGVPVWFEIKAPGKDPSPDQEFAIAELKKNGCLVFVVDDPDQVERILSNIKAMEFSVKEIQRRIKLIQDVVGSAGGRSK